MLTFFPNRAAFDTAAPMLPVEDFENLTRPVGSFGFDFVGDVLDSNSDIGPIAPGDILPGISFTTANLAQSPDSLVLLNPAGDFTTSNALGPNIPNSTVFDSLVIEFGTAVEAVGFDFQFIIGGENAQYDVAFYNGNTLLGVQTVVDDLGLLYPSYFVGAIAGQGNVITQVRFENEFSPTGGSVGVVVDNVAFGTVIPEPMSGVTALLGLAISCVSSRQRVI